MSKMAGYWFRQPRCHFCGALIERPDDGVVCWEESIESSGKWRAQNFAVAHNRCVPTERPFQCDALTQVNPGYLTGLALRFTRRMYEQVDVPALVRLVCELFPDEAGREGLWVNIFDFMKWDDGFPPELSEPRPIFRGD
ncbi:MAG: hypothetical protein RRB24_04320 [Armatimonadota bacterium]|jgi:hypothetical protein|nr:hypothetical protein [Armatimonadota bacterium]MDT7972034.1 hypothetical protein [Armatimonadota bacterium]